MAKRKVRKETETKKMKYSKELEGLILVLIGIIGFGKFGIVGDIILKFSVFLCGNWYFIILMLSLLVGTILIVSRKPVNYFSARFIGLYTIILAILLFSHIEYLKDTDLRGVEIMRTTLENIKVAIENMGELRNTGGGMIGSLIAYIFVSLFDLKGTEIVVLVLGIFSIIMLFDINLAAVFASLLKPFKKEHSEKVEKLKSIEEIENEANDEEEEPAEEKRKIVITSVDDLKKENPVINYEEPKYSEQLDMNDYNEEYVLPSIDLLKSVKRAGKINSTEFITSSTKVLERVFKDFNILGKVVEVHQGPSVTQFEIELSPGTKVNKILSINREIALALAAKDVRIQAPIPGKSTIGIEIPNPVLSPVSMKDVLLDMPKKLAPNKLVAPLGMNIMGASEFVEINKTPHMLIAGATGSGKSVCINNIITSILLRATPEEVKMVLVDPKKVELNVYDAIPHLLMPVVTNPKKAAVALQKIVMEMDRRYDVFNESLTKNLEGYNEYIEKWNKKNPNNQKEKMPYILVIIDELADLMLVAAKDVEESITRITQLARAAGIHLIVATQRPSTDVITGLIKANIPTRLSFAVSSSIDSRTILDATGAEKLLGKGDMLFWPMGASAPTRIQGSMLTDEEIQAVASAAKRNRKPMYDEKFKDLEHKETPGVENYNEDDDPVYNEALEFTIKTGKVSASLLQRKFRLGYNRAARLIDLMEERGVIGAQNGSKPREVLVKLEENKEE